MEIDKDFIKYSVRATYHSLYVYFGLYITEFLKKRGYHKVSLEKNLCFSSFSMIGKRLKIAGVKTRLD